MKLLIKLGGALLDVPEHRAKLGRQISLLVQARHSIVIVHGGGRQMTRFLEESGVTSEFVDGLRVTSDRTMEAVIKVLAGSVNKQLVGVLRQHGVSALGLTGLDGGLIQASQLRSDLGCVGRVDSVDASLLELLISDGKVPVVACIGGDDQGRAWNINADHMAVSCATAFRADRLIFLTDVAGVMDESRNVLSTINPVQLTRLIGAGIASGGMRAKLEAASAALSDGVGSVVIAPGAQEDVLNRLVLGDPVGTAFVNA